ncbi:hypothetical protein ETB97_009884 [Aspergillus alliaceus]|uniref:MARVEL domain-containing protein n=1 Tax=Petromyces alliaceus TaxID=209559 RepID=A0A8H6AG05_PETAA|nr:hypothetical protein ETB97_009884 [Aspergillus burnettii]
MPKYGALGATFMVARIIQAFCLIAIIGLTANFIAEIVNSDLTPPNVFIGTITVTCIAVIYCTITMILFLDDILPFLASAIADFLLLIAVIVVAVIIGKPLSYLQCNKIAAVTDNISSAFAFATKLSSYLSHLDGKLQYGTLIGASKGYHLLFLLNLLHLSLEAEEGKWNGEVGRLTKIQYDNRVTGSLKNDDDNVVGG